MISTDQIRKILKDTWPDLQFIWGFNPSWIEVTDDWLIEIRANCKVNDLTFIPKIWECENYTLQFKANVEKFQYELHMSGFYQPEWRWAVGEIMGVQSDIFGNAVVHAINIIFTKDGFVLYEPQEDTILKAYTFVPFYVRF